MNPIAWIFPGQGSQNQGMLAELAQAYPIVTETFTEASDVLHENLWQIAQENPDDRLNQTLWTQPIMLAAGIACLRVYQQEGGLDAAAVCGHSLGEYSALVAADSLDFVDAIALVHRRGRYMQEAVAQVDTRMAAILGLDAARISALCQEVSCDGSSVDAANFNAPEQTVIAGHADAVERASAACLNAGAKRAIPLAVSVPSHCRLMEPAALALAHDLNSVQLRAPRIAIVQNCSAEATQDVDSIRQNLIAQLDHPVRWVESVRALQTRGIEQCYEFGSGNVLTGLIKRIDRALPCQSLNSPASFQNLKI